MKTKIAVVVLSDCEGMADFGRMAHALYLMRDAGPEAQLVLVGAGVKWPAFFAQKDPHPFRDYFRPVYADARRRICGGSADKFDMTQALAEAGETVEGGPGDHISLNGLLAGGVHVVTF